MAKIKYWRIMDNRSFYHKQVTMLATGDDEADRLVMSLYAAKNDMVVSGVFEQWESESAGGWEPAPDGKDLFREHTRLPKDSWTPDTSVNLIKALPTEALGVLYSEMLNHAMAALREGNRRGLQYLNDKDGFVPVDKPPEG